MVHSLCMAHAWSIRSAGGGGSLAGSGEKPDTRPRPDPGFEREANLGPEPTQAIRRLRLLIPGVRVWDGYSCVNPVRYLVILLLAGTLSSCDRPVNPDALTVTLEPTEEPEAFYREGLGRRTTTDAPGLWAVVSQLPRAESAVIRNARSGAEVTVALFAARRSVGGSDIEISAEAADALGIGEEPASVSVTAVRVEPNLVVPKDVF